ncbi:MAG: outer membrane beta-barrel protein [Acidobacteriaceae bacterium]|nr:outer membrane beta-barrel protein [Acidobacteriaceae bacterium]
MKYTLIAGLVSLGFLVSSAHAQEGTRNDVSLSVFGAFQQSTSGNGVNQSAENQPGILVTYRHYLTDHQGLEFDYGLAQFTQQYTGIGGLNLTPLGLSQTNANILANTHEGTMSYVYRLAARHRLSPFVTAGGGVLVFAPLTGSLGTGVLDTYITPDFVYGGGADFAATKHLNLRLGYRGHVFEAPGFGIAQIKTGSVTHMAEPFAGISFHW